MVLQRKTAASAFCRSRRTVFAFCATRLRFVQRTERLFDDVLRREAEHFEQLVRGAARAEGRHADDLARIARVLVPGVGGTRLHAHARLDFGREHLVLIALRLFFELLEAGHGNDARVDALRFQDLLRLHALFHFRTAGDEQHVGRLLFAVGKHIAALERSQPRIFVLRQVLAGEDKAGGRVPFERGDPRRRRLFAVGGAVHLHAGDGAQRDELFDGFVRGAVFADADGVMRQNVDDGLVHERGEAHRVFHIVGEDKEGGAVAFQPAVQLHAVGDRRHRVLADAEVHVRPALILRGEVAALFHVGLVGGRKVRRAADEVGDEVGELVEHGKARVARRVGFCELEEGGVVFQVGQLPAHEQFVLRRKVGVLRLVFLEHPLPLALAGNALFGDRRAVRRDLFGDLEGRARPAEVVLQLLQVLRAEGRAVALVRACERRAVADDRFADDDRGALGIRLRLAHGAAQKVQIVRVVHLQHLPALRLEAHRHVLFEGDVRIALDGDVVVVIEEDEFAQLVRARKGAGLVRDALFEAPVAAQRIGVMVDDGEALAVEGGGEVRLGDRHADGVRDALPERAGRRFDAGRVAVFGVPGRFVPELAEVHHVLFGDVIPEEVQKRVVEHGAVPRGEDETVSVVPLRVLRVELQKVREDGVPDGRAAQGQPGMPRVRLLDRFRREHADRVYRFLPYVVHCIILLEL